MMQSRELLARKAAAKDLFLNTWFDFHFPYGPLKIISSGTCCSRKEGCPGKTAAWPKCIFKEPFSLLLSQYSAESLLSKGGYSYAYFCQLS